MPRPFTAHTPQHFGPLAIRLESLRKYEFKILQTNWISKDQRLLTNHKQNKKRLRFSKAAGPLYSNEIHFQLNAYWSFWGVVIWNKIYELRTWCQLHVKYEWFSVNERGEIQYKAKCVVVDNKWSSIVAFMQTIYSLISDQFRSIIWIIQSNAS